MERFHGIRKASQMTRNIPAGYYLQISLDTAGSGIVTALCRGDAGCAWRRYQSEFIYPVLNTLWFMPEEQIAAAAARALETAAQAQALAERENALRRQRCREAEAYPGSALRGTQGRPNIAALPVSRVQSNQTAQSGKLIYCTVCLAAGCGNRHHEHYFVDERMVPILSKLHRKGYQTRYCCSGHAEEVGGEYHTYITFAKAYAFAPPKGFFISRPYGGRHKSPRLAVIAPPEAWRRKVLVEDAQSILDRNLDTLVQWTDAVPAVKSAPAQRRLVCSYPS